MNITEYVQKMTDDELQKFVATAVTEESWPEDDELLNAVIDECKKRKLDILQKQK